MIDISYHARERIKQRLGTSDRKMDQLVLKAWNSDIRFSRKTMKAEYKTETLGRECRELMGYVFVFAKEESMITLITVF